MQNDPGLAEGVRTRIAAIPLGGLGTRADIPEAVAFFASPATARAMGETFLNDGGTLLV